MWVKILKSYSGVYGLFFAGHKYDLPEKTIAKLPKESYKKIPAPWDEYIDKAAVKKMRLVTEAKEAAILADLLQYKADKARQAADALVAPAKSKQDAADKAKRAADAAVEKTQKKGATDKDKKHAFGLARESTRKDLERQMAMGELTTALAEAELKQMEAEDAKRKVKEAAEAAGLPAEADAGNAGDASETKVDAPLANGQAVQP